MDMNQAYQRAIRRSLVPQRYAILPALRSPAIDAGRRVSPDSLVAAVLVPRLAVDVVAAAFQFIDEHCRQARFEEQPAPVVHYRASGLA